MKRFVAARVLRATVAKLLLVLFRTRVHGAERIPAGGAILAGNHVSYMDPVLLWCASPRPVHFMAKRELWDAPVIGWALPRLWGFPVTRGAPDREAITTATQLLQGGELVGVFPEGTRQDTGDESLGQAQGGTAFIAMRAEVPVVPVAFVGTDRVWPRGARFPRLAKTAIHVGEPIDPVSVAPGAARKERVEALTRVIMEAIAAELDRAGR
jgi:1-acyl-sn-glycerol-3-phosphate acyltransferase